MNWIVSSSGPSRPSALAELYTDPEAGDAHVAGIPLHLRVSGLPAHNPEQRLAEAVVHTFKPTSTGQTEDFGEFVWTDRLGQMGVESDVL